jgi:hypothetical protein
MGRDSPRTRNATRASSRCPYGRLPMPRISTQQMPNAYTSVAFDRFTAPSSSSGACQQVRGLGESIRASLWGLHSAKRPGGVEPNFDSLPITNAVRKHLHCQRIQELALNSAVQRSCSICCRVPDRHSVSFRLATDTKYNLLLG